MFIIGGSGPLFNSQYRWTPEVSLRACFKAKTGVDPSQFRGKGTMELCEDKNNRDYFWRTVSQILNTLASLGLMEVR